MKINKISEETKPKKPVRNRKFDGQTRVDFFVSIREDLSKGIRSWAAKKEITLSKAAELIIEETLKHDSVIS